MDRVFIEGLEVDTVIGAYDWEREIRQCLRLDLSFAWDNRKPAADDDLSLALDYATVSARIQAFAQDAQFILVETFAERFRGYGLMAVVDHGGGSHTLYAHLGELAVKAGDKVEAGTVLGLAGDTPALGHLLGVLPHRQAGAWLTIAGQSRAHKHGRAHA